MSDFKIHALCIVKNEGDIIRCCLSQARQWADYIYVVDNGSTDNTWDELLAITDRNVIPWKRHNKPFQESLRAEIFNEFRTNAGPGDWWCQLDGDEFYNIRCPRAFLSRLPQRCQAVSSVYVQYYLTQVDVALIDFGQPIDQVLPHIRYYRADHCEPKWFRHRNRIHWGADKGRPSHMGLMAKQQMLMRHYKYRSPQQIQRRLDTRREARANGFTGWECHATDDSWQDKIVQDPTSLHYDNKDGAIIVEPNALDACLDPLRRRLLAAAMHSLGIWA